MTNTSADRIEQIARVLEETGKAHHAAFIETDGVDPEWTLWYATYLHDKLPALLEAELTRADIVYLLQFADKQRALTAPGSRWPRFYATLFARQYGLLL